MKIAFWTSILLVSASIGGFRVVSRPLAEVPVVAERAEKPILRMELARDAADAAPLINTPARRDAMAKAQYVDFVFIAGYAALLAVCAWSVAWKSGLARFLLALPAILLVFAAAIADVVEDIWILKTLQNAAFAGNIRGWALWKWALFAAAVFAAGALVAFRDRSSVVYRWLAGAAGSFAMACAALCVWTIVSGMDDPAIERTASLVIAAVLPIVIYAFFDGRSRPVAADAAKEAAAAAETTA